ncbi:hypothetical protein Val02_48580 [Virgisporangium aliadipatigenens]|uniref:histidine kinase n=1 Tax=Virgisporangium aliadipatigenens TaxID=741659 RepID=A0A8J3YP34_9ACTN|nr:histidine kinase [Virgisporangium aliadipatigenens]GIJ47972.1 hypothetical protein Val02_48580 [Virgisporangium aliadipatigenens]
MQRPITAAGVARALRLAERGRWVSVWRLGLPATVFALSLLDVRAHPFDPVLGLAVAGALLCRFRWPGAALVGGVLVAALATVGDTAVPALLGLPSTVFLSYAAGRRVNDRRRALLVAAAAVAISTVRDVFLGLRQPEWTGTVVVGGVLSLVLILLPFAVGVIVGERARTLEALHERNALLERANRLADQRARMQERARIAGEMHDLIGHRLSLITLHAGALELRTRDQSPEISKQADLLRTTSRTALSELRAVLGILRLDAGAPDDGTDQVGSRADIVGLVAESRAAGLPVDLSWHGTDLTEAAVPLRRAVHRIVRESLTNVHRHAPAAPTKLSVEIRSGHVHLEIRNARRGPGAPTAGTGLGLTGLRERARLAGGTLTAGTDGGTGDFVVRASLPLDPAVGRSDRTDLSFDHDDVADRQMPATGAAAQARNSDGTYPRSAQAMSKTVKTSMIVIAVLVLLACGGIGYGIYYIVNVMDDSITAETYQKVQAGDSREHVRDLINGDQDLARESVKGTEPAAPEGTSCDYALARSAESVYRFCFKDGRLVHKDEIPVPKK